jgi:hypothetical protein
MLDYRAPTRMTSLVNFGAMGHLPIRQLSLSPVTLRSGSEDLRMRRALEAALDAEPVILENSGHTSENYKYGRCGMSDNNRLSRKLAALIIAPWTTKAFPRN